MPPSRSFSTRRFCDPVPMIASSEETPPDDYFLAHIHWFMTLIDHLDERYTNRFVGNVGRPGSDLSEDDALLGPFASSYRVANCLTIALDQLRAVRAILRPEADGPVSVPFIGPYPNIRAVLEASALAIYLLESDDPRERQARALRAAWDGILHDEDIVEAECSIDRDTDDAETRSRKTRELADNLAETKSYKDVVRAQAKKLRLPVALYSNRLPGFRAIVRSAAQNQSFSAENARFIWQMLSGMAHPSFRRNSQLSEVTSLGENAGVSGDFPQTKVGFLNSSIDISVTLFVKALELTSIRANDLSIRWLARRDLPDPPAWNMTG